MKINIYEARTAIFHQRPQFHCGLVSITVVTSFISKAYGFHVMIHKWSVVI